MENSIHKDMEEVDKKITEFVAKLNSERMIEIRKKVSLMDFYALTSKAGNFIPFFFFVQTLNDTNPTDSVSLPNGMILSEFQS